MPRVTDEYLEARRREIVDAAITCFSRDGFHRATMQDIVRETGLSAGAIYRYFSSKEDIVAAIADEHHAGEAMVLEGAENRTDTASILRDLVHESLGRLTDPAEQRWRRITVQVWAEALRDERVMRIVRGGVDEPIRMIADVIRRGQQDGTFPRGVDPAGAARVFASVFFGLVLQQAWDPSVDVHAYMDTVLGLIAALAIEEASGRAPSSGV